MKNYIPYVVIILVLAVAAVWFIKSQSKGTINDREGDFAVKDSKDVFKIVLTDAEKNRVELSNSNGVWMVNGKYVAREDLSKQLLDAITRVTSLCPVPSAAHDNVIREMMSHHVRVEVFDSKNNLLKSYLVGGPSLDGQNTYMLLEMDGKLAARPHMTYIPNFKGYLTPRFSTDEENWRTRILYNYTVDDIQSVSVNYPADEKRSFSINRLSADSFELIPADEKFRINNSYPQQLVKQYLGFYSSVFIEAFDNSYSKKDSVTKTIPYCTITVIENDNSVNKVNLFHMPISKRSKTDVDAKGNEINYDIDHYHASIHNGRDFVIVQYYVFGKLLRSYSDFFFKPA